MVDTSKTLVLITGGNAGIGYEIVKKLAPEQPSYHILMGTRDIKRGEEACSKLGNPKNVEPIQLDIRSDASIDECFETIQQKFGGRLDILINNAGTSGKDMGEKRTTAKIRDVYNHVYEVNVIGMAVLTEKMIPPLKKSSHPKIINITSGLGSIELLQSGKQSLIPVPFYNSSKASMNYLTAYWAQLYKDDGFKVNCVCPGLRATGLNDVELNKNTDPALGAIRAVQLATERPDGRTGTYTHKDGEYPW